MSCPKVENVYFRSLNDRAFDNEAIGSSGTKIGAKTKKLWAFEDLRDQDYSRPIDWTKTTDRFLSNFFQWVQYKNDRSFSVKRPIDCRKRPIVFCSFRKQLFSLFWKRAVISSTVITQKNRLCCYINHPNLSPKSPITISINILQTLS